MYKIKKQKIFIIGLIFFSFLNLQAKDLFLGDIVLLKFNKKDNYLQVTSKEPRFYEGSFVGQGKDNIIGSVDDPEDENSMWVVTNWNNPKVNLGKPFKFQDELSLWSLRSFMKGAESNLLDSRFRFGQSWLCLVTSVDFGRPEDDRTKVKFIDVSNPNSKSKIEYGKPFYIKAAFKDNEMFDFNFKEQRGISFDSSQDKKPQTSFVFTEPKISDLAEKKEILKNFILNDYKKPEVTERNIFDSIKKDPKYMMAKAVIQPFIKNLEKEISRALSNEVRVVYERIKKNPDPETLTEEIKIVVNKALDSVIKDQAQKSLAQGGFESLLNIINVLVSNIPQKDKAVDVIKDILIEIGITDKPSSIPAPVKIAPIVKPVEEIKTLEIKKEEEPESLFEYPVVALEIKHIVKPEITIDSTESIMREISLVKEFDQLKTIYKKIGKIAESLDATKKKEIAEKFVSVADKFKDEFEKESNIGKEFKVDKNLIEKFIKNKYNLFDSYQIKTFKKFIMPVYEFDALLDKVFNESELKNVLDEMMKKLFDYQIIWLTPSIYSTLKSLYDNKKLSINFIKDLITKESEGQFKLWFSNDQLSEIKDWDTKLTLVPTLKPLPPAPTKPLPLKPVTKPVPSVPAVVQGAEYSYQKPSEFGLGEDLFE